MRTFAIVYRVAEPKWSAGWNRINGHVIGVQAVAWRWCLSLGRRRPPHQEHVCVPECREPDGHIAATPPNQEDE